MWERSQRIDEKVDLSRVNRQMRAQAGDTNFISIIIILVIVIAAGTLLIGFWGEISTFISDKWTAFMSTLSGV